MMNSSSIFESVKERSLGETQGLLKEKLLCLEQMIKLLQASLSEGGPSSIVNSRSLFLPYLFNHLYTHLAKQLY